MEEMRRVAAFPQANPKPVMALDMDGRILFANPAALQTFPGLEAEGLLHPALAGCEAIIAAFREGTTNRVRRELEVVGVYYYQVFFHATALNRVLVYMTDITDLKQTQFLLALERDLLKNILDVMDDGVCILGADYSVEYSNPALERQFGPPAGRKCFEYFYDCECPCEHCRSAEVLAGRSVRWEWLHAGTGRTFDVSASPFRNADGSVSKLEIFHDITDRKKAQDRLAAYQRRLRSLGAKLAVVEEQERRRIAAGLHDNVVQALVLAKMKLEGLAAEALTAPVSQAILDIRGLVEQSVGDTRALLFDLSPVALYELGFGAAVESLIERIQTAHGLAVSFRTDGCAQTMTNELRVVLFRAVREVIHNIVKHAHARNVKVTIRREVDMACVEVRDDGVGFDTEKVLSVRDDTGGFGLFDVRERLDYLGGSLTVRSEPGKGTAVLMRAPLVRMESRAGR